MTQYYPQPTMYIDYWFELLLTLDAGNDLSVPTCKAVFIRTDEPLKR